MNKSPFISKTKYIAGIQCHKLLWHYYNAKEEFLEVDAGTQALFDQGHLVGEYAKKRYPTGIEVSEDIIAFEKVIEQSKQLISKRLPLFEAAFRYENVYARADILNPVGRKAWEIIEVKSSTQVKDIHLYDLSLQWYTYKGTGLEIKRCYLLHINNEYVRKGEIDPGKLFALEDITSDVKILLPEVEGRLEKMIKVIAAKKYPKIEIGLHCNDPYECPLQEKCFDYLPRHNPLTLYYFKGEKAFSLINDGVTDILKFDDSITLSAKQKIQIQSLRSKREYVNKEGIQSFLNKLAYPLYYLDFETIGTAIPLFDHVKPYQQIPFQFSLHIQASPKSKLEHIGYLAEGKDDPRPELLKLLKKHLGMKGSIVTYNASFEKDKLNKACEAFPAYREWNRKIQARIVDLLDPFKAFYYYNYKQEGSASIKSVLPVLTGKGYDGMEIADGGTASNEYLRVTYGEGVTEKERKTVRKYLEEYCELDTMAMVKIVEKLIKISNGKVDYS
ncbi:DUF2779 domain-containing protein [uncultured Candidatus Kuenenia sp.]|jgi:hypothetical protein|uniref:DUF2779 domain-containing protein n=1 Tax=uncultured Candidatus Kuenenia sp. TaxID=1048336 RepID=UPI0002D28EC3|nr:DUF2779 domain-containing protein [uncultured Candidatus Kuenenia sp.]